MKLLKTIFIQILIISLTKQSIFDIDSPIGDMSALRVELKERFLANQKTEEYFKSLKELITQNFTDQKIENYTLDLEKDTNTEFKMNFLNKNDETNKENFIDAKIDSINENNIVINFKNLIDTSTLTLTNINPADEEEKNVIQDKYIKKYFSHLSQIKSEVEILAIIKKTIEDNKKEEIKIEFLEPQNESSLKIGIQKMAEEEEGENSEQKVNEEIEIKIQEKKVNFITKYFESNFSITIPTETFITHQIKELFNNIQSHYLKIKTFTSSQNTEEMEIDCEIIGENFDKNVAYKSFTFQREGNDKKTIIKFVNNKGEIVKTKDKQGVETEPEISYSCFETDTRVYFLKVEIGKLGVMEQAFLSQSLYDLTVVISGFWEDVFDRIIQYYAPERDSGLKVFID